MRALLALAALLVLGCAHPPQAKVPGTTRKKIASVTVVTPEGKTPALDLKKLLGSMGHRPGNVIVPPRLFNPYRLAEDTRRVTAFAAMKGYFDATVSEPTVEEKKDGLHLRWELSLGAKYRVGKLELVGAPAELESELFEMIPFRVGSDLAVRDYRKFRHKLAERMRWHGYSHARVYTRSWVDRERKEVRWYYFADPGPRTHVASIEVAGNERVSVQEILERSGLKVGQKLGLRERQRAQLALMDGGSLASVVIEADEDIHKGPPELPDSGGHPLTDVNGDMVKRELSPGLELRISVVEAPKMQTRVEAGSEVDPARADLFAGLRVIRRDLATSGLHLVADGLIAHGFDLGVDSEPIGWYGQASAAIVKTSLFGSKTDLRWKGELRHTLYPGAAVRELWTGPELRRTLADRLYLDLGVRAFAAEEVNALELADPMRASAGLATNLESRGGKLVANLVYDARDNPIEAIEGSFASLYLESVPPGLGSEHQWTRASGDLRRFWPLSSPGFGLAGRLSASWVLGADDDGVPLHNRLFGGGSYGFRGYGRQLFSPAVEGARVGGESLVEASFEGRFLKAQELYGLMAFADVGAVSSDANPVADGVSLAMGLGGRLRLFYLPLSVDLSYRLVDRNRFESPLELSPWAVFARLGEAF